MHMVGAQHTHGRGAACCAPTMTDPPYPFTRREVDNMTTRRSILIGTAIVAGTALWYLFRPEALVINKTVSESFPAAEHAMSSMTKSPGMSAMAAHEPVKVVSRRFSVNFGAAPLAEQSS